MGWQKCFVFTAQFREGTLCYVRVQQVINDLEKNAAQNGLISWVTLAAQTAQHSALWLSLPHGNSKGRTDGYLSSHWGTNTTSTLLRMGEGHSPKCAHSQMHKHTASDKGELLPGSLSVVSAYKCEAECSHLCVRTL